MNTITYIDKSYSYKFPNEICLKGFNNNQITYYTDNETMKPFPDQLFPKVYIVEKELYTDANCITKPIYKRIVEECNPSCLSFITDTQRARDDILASILTRRNEEMYMV